MHFCCDFTQLFYTLLRGRMRRKQIGHAADSGTPIAVRVHAVSLDAPGHTLSVTPSRTPTPSWREFSWLEAREAIRLGKR